MKELAQFSQVNMSLVVYIVSESWVFCSSAEVQHAAHSMLLIEKFVKSMQNKVYYVFLLIHLQKMKSNEIIFNHYYVWPTGD